MTQKAAASLSSSLFARKGKASPASLLISELEAADAGGPHERAGANGATSNGTGSNGAARRKSKPQADLPLLAYVEAQQEADDDVQPREANASTNGSAAAAKAKAAAKAAAERARADLPPAASLLERGGKPLRRTNGSAATASLSPVDSEIPIAPAPEHTAQPKAGDEAIAADAADEDAVHEAETVSGDANVAAIEDASDEEHAAAASEMAPEVIEPEAEATEPAADSAEAVGAAEAAPPKDTAVEDKPAEAAAVDAAPSEPAEAVAVTPEAKPQEKTEEESRAAAPGKLAGGAKAEAAVAASVALRHAKALQAEAPRQAPAVETARPLPPRPRVAGQPSRSYLWRGAAVVALGVALGFGAYLVFAGKPAEPPAPVSAEVPVTPPAPEAQPDATAEAAAPVETVAAAATETPPPAEQAAEAAATAVPATLPEPSFDIIRIEPDGQSIIAGRAQPFSEWILLNNGAPIASVKADVNGEWVVLPDASLVPGANAFSLVPKTERGKVAIPAPGAEAPQAVPQEENPAKEAQAPAAPAVEGALLPPAKPVNAAEIAATGQTLPKPKPAQAGRETPQLAATPVAVPGGAYEVQLASVRQTADAARERDRLAAAFPDLLGALDLRVQEAAVDGAGTFYRVRSGAIADLGLAREICRRLEAGGQGCLVVRRDTEPAASPAAAPVTELVEEVPAEPDASAVGQQAERPTN